MTKLISVITCVYNGEKTIEDTIQSVLQQNFENFEYIIIDGKSNDDTLKIVNNYSQKDPRIKLISESDTGIYDAYNKGIARSTGDILIYVNADDFLFQGAIKAIHDQFNPKEYDLFAGSISILNEESRYYKEHYRSKIPRHSLTNPSVLTPGICFTRKVFQKIGEFDTSFRICADFDLISRSLNRGLKIQYSDVLLNHMREGGISSDIRFERIKKIEQIKVYLKNSNKLNFSFITSIVVKYVKTILLNSLFKKELQKRRKQIQNKYNHNQIFWFR
jgi:glycosyltransferase involved in cell wall biosynthesis